VVTWANNRGAQLLPKSQVQASEVSLAVLLQLWLWLMLL